MILTKLGVLSTAQDLTADTVESEEILNITALGIDGPQPASNLYLDIETETIATGDSAVVFTFNLVLSDHETTLDNGTVGTDWFNIVGVVITDFEDPRIATAGNKILSCQIPDTLRMIARTDATLLYLGLLLTVSGGATLSVNAAIMMGRPDTAHNVQVTRSNVAVPT